MVFFLSFLRSVRNFTPHPAAGLFSPSGGGGKSLDFRSFLVAFYALLPSLSETVSAEIFFHSFDARNNGLFAPCPSVETPFSPIVLSLVSSLPPLSDWFHQTWFRRR